VTQGYRQCHPSIERNGFLFIFIEAAYVFRDVASYLSKVAIP